VQNNPQRSLLDQPANYKIEVQGCLDASWSEWFDGMSIIVTKDEDGMIITTMTGLVTDQVALHGLLARIRDLGLSILLVRCLKY
jgi:hypothetical protein